MMLDHLQILVLFGALLVVIAPAVAQKERILTPRGATKQEIIKPLPEGMSRSLNETVERSSQDEALDLEINGLIVDQTITKSGRDFYEIFYGRWLAPREAKNFTIYIKEIPWQGRAQLTRISLLIGENEVVTFPLQPRFDVVEERAKYTLGRVYNYLLNYEQIQSDLQSEDQQGTGIF